MRRLTERDQQREIVKGAAQRWQAMVEVPRETWPTSMMSAKPLRFWKNNKYTCIEFPSRETEFGLVRHLLIQRVTAERISRWDHLQRIKNETAGPWAVAIEMYPPESQVVNDCHVCHLWVLPERFPLPGIGIGHARF